MGKLFEKAKQNSLLGARIRRLFKIKFMAIAILFVISALFVCASYSTGDETIQAISTLIMAAPVILAIPKDVTMSDEDRATLEALAETFNKQLEEYTSGLITSEQLNTSIKEKFDDFMEGKSLEDCMGEMQKILKEQGLEIKAIKETKPEKQKTLRDLIKEALTTEGIANLKQDKRGQIQIVAKAPTIMTTASNAAAPHSLSLEIVPGIQEAPVEPPAILVALNKGRVSSRVIIWVNRINEEGGAAFIAEGVLKPLKSWEHKEETSTAKKVAVRSKISSEMLADFEYILSEVEILLYRDLYQVVDEKLLNGTTADEPNGIITGAGGYLGTGLDGTIQMPNNADAIRAAMLQMRLLGFKPDIVFMNPTDVAMNFLEKSSDGHYIRLELDGVISGVRVIETLAMNPGKFLLMDKMRWIVKILDEYRIEFGWENDDFTRNLITVIAELRLHSYQFSVDAGSVIYDDFAVVKTAIEAP